ncbi:unnamed protein product, partial [Vitis vinifera]
MLGWSTRLDNHPASLVAVSGTFYNWDFYVGTSSLEEASDQEHCCTFRGSLCKLDTKSGAILWKTLTLPDNGGGMGEYAGAGDVKWYMQLGSYDVWLLACTNLSTANCPLGPNPDADFGKPQ